MHNRILKKLSNLLVILLASVLLIGSFSMKVYAQENKTVSQNITTDNSISQDDKLVTKNIGSSRSNETGDIYYNVTYDLNGGYYRYDREFLGVYTEQLREGQHANLYSGHIFHDTKAISHWTDEDGKVYKNLYDIVINKNKTITAQWGDAYNVTIKTDNKGYLINELGYYSNEIDIKVLKGESLKLDNYRPIIKYEYSNNWMFDDFYTDLSYSQKAGSYSFVPKGDCTIYARYVKKYTITYDANGGYFYKTDSYFSDTREKSVKQGDVEYAHSIPIAYNDNGKAFAGYALTPNATKPILRKNSRYYDSEYKFTPTSNVTLYAVWVDGITVTIYGEGGSFDGQEETKVYNLVPGSKISSAYNFIYEPKKDGYIFDAYYPTREFNITEAIYQNSRFNGINDYIFDKNTSLYAKYNEAATYTFDPGEGSFSNSYTNGKYVVSAAKGSVFDKNVPTPDIEGYVFEGWYEDENFTSEREDFVDHIVENNKTYYAKYTDVYTITYHTNGGTCYYNGNYESNVYVRKFKYNEYVPSYYIWGGLNRDGYTATRRLFYDEECTQEVQKEHGFRITQNYDFYVEWSNDYITIDFDLNGGYVSNNQKSIQILRGKNVGSYPFPDIDEAKAFVGWESDLDGFIGKNLYEYIPSDSTTLRAVWTDNVYRVSLHDVDGLIYHAGNNYYDYTFYIEQGASASSASVSVSGMALGYYSDPSYNNFVCKYLSELYPTSDMDLYVKKGNDEDVYFKVNINPNGGYWIDNYYYRNNYSNYIWENLDSRSKYTLQNLYVPIFEKEGQTFVGLSQTPDGDVLPKDFVIDHEQTLYAVYSDDYCNVRFDFNGGSYMRQSFRDVLVPKGATIRISEYCQPEHPERLNISHYEGYINGSKIDYKNEVYVDQDMTLTAQWIDSLYTLHFVVEGGSILSDSIIYSDGRTSINLGYYEATSYSGKPFVGWYDNPEFTGEVYTGYLFINRDMTLYAKFADYYTVTFDANGRTFADGTTVKIYQANKNDFVYDLGIPEIGDIGRYKAFWSSKANDIFVRHPEYETVQSDIVYFLRLFIPTESITINNGDLTLYVGDEVQLNSTVLPLDGTYRGSVDYKVADDSIVSLDYRTSTITALKPGVTEVTLATVFGLDDRVSDTITVTVIERDKFTVNFVSEGGSKVESQVIEDGGNKATRPEDPTRAGYEFAGWYLNDELYDFDNPVTENITLIAKWNKIVVVSNIELAEYEKKIKVNSTYNIVVTKIEPQDVENNTLLYSVDDENIATVDANGKVTGVSAGSTWVRVTSADSNVTVSIRIIVEDIPDALETEQLIIRPEELVIKVGESGQFYAYQPEDLSNEELEWSVVEGSDLVTIDENGQVTANDTPGEARIKATIKVYDEEALNNALEAAQAEYDEANANLDNANNELEALQESLDEKTTEYNKAVEQEQEDLVNKQEAQSTLDSYYDQLNYAREKLANAQTNLENARQAKADAQANYEAAKQAGDEAQEQYDKGSLGFFEYNGSTNAVNVINTRINTQDNDTKWGKTDLGAKGDATSIENMKKAIDLLPITNQLRADDPNNSGANKEPLLVTDYLMAVAQVQTNASAIVIGHTGNDTSSLNYGLGYKKENLAWGRENPFEQWYDQEKPYFESGNYLEAGHYMNIVNPLNASNMVFKTMGLGVTTKTGTLYRIANGQAFGWGSYNEVDISDQRYTTDEYRAIFYQYLEDIEEAINAADNLLQAIEDAENDISLNEEYVERYSNEIVTLDEKISSQETKVKQANQKYENSKSKLDTIQEELDSISNEYMIAENNVTTAQETLDEKSIELENAKERINKITAYAKVIVEKKVEGITINPGTDNSGTDPGEGQDPGTDPGPGSGDNPGTDPGTDPGSGYTPPVSGNGTEDDPIVITPGGNHDLGVEITPDDSSNQKVTWSSSDPSVVTVDENGNIIAVGPGDATITVRTEDGNNSYTVHIHVPYVVTFIGLEESEIMMDVNDEYTIVPTVLPKEAKLENNYGIRYESSDPTIASVDENGKVTGLKAGEATITIKATDGSNVSTQFKVKVRDVESGHIIYRCHVQNIGWQPYVSDGVMSGTSGKSLRLESINIKLEGFDDYDLGIQYTTHVQGYGWMPWSTNNEMSGTSGESKRLEAIKIQLIGSDKDLFDVYYRVHAQNYGWLYWAKNGEASGTAGYGYRLEGIQIVIVPKGNTLPNYYQGINTTKTMCYISKTGIKNPTVKGENSTNIVYRSNVQKKGWLPYVYNGKVSGTSGESLRLEALQIQLRNQQFEGNIMYNVHVQNIGWQGWKINGETAGTIGKDYRLEAIRIKLTGILETEYDVYYRLHVQNVGWMGWAKNGEDSGSAGYSYRVEGVQIVLVKKGDNPPNSIFEGIKQNTTKHFLTKN